MGNLGSESGNYIRVTNRRWATEMTGTRRILPLPTLATVAPTSANEPYLASYHLTRSETAQPVSLGQINLSRDPLNSPFLVSLFDHKAVLMDLDPTPK
jgi:hypothetical protein